MKELTKAEERVMLVCWKLKKAFVKDIIAKLSMDPRPPYNTVSSVARILTAKGYLAYKAYGKTHEYYPAISKSEYRRIKLNNLMAGYFGGSPANLVTFILKEEKLSKQEFAKLKKAMAQLK